MGYLLGIDCGGTKIQAIAYQHSGEEIIQIMGGAGNLVVNYEKSKAEIIRVITEIKAAIPDQTCEFALLGIAGLDSGGFKDQLRTDLSDVLPSFELINDGQLAHFNCLNGEDGMIVISGTGSVGIGRVKHRWYRSGGWGHILGDEGSAYWIGKSAVKQLLQEADTGIEWTVFSSGLLTYFQAKNEQEVVKKFYQMDKAEVAKIALFIAKYLPDEEITQSIFSQAGFLLARMACQLANRMDLQEYKIGLTGSVLEHNQEICEMFMATISKDYVAQFYSCQYPNAHGVLPYYQKEMRKEE